MSDEARDARLTRMFAPSSIAFVGGAALEPAIDYTRRVGFGGAMHVVNPRRNQLAGLACVRSPHDLPGPPDVAFVAVPGEGAIDATRDLAAAGAGVAIVNSAGFAEVGGDGPALQERLNEAAMDMPFLGPNCPGFVNFLDRTAILMGDMGVFELERGVAVVSNGGAYLADIACSDRSLPLAYIAGLGNQANVSVSELLDIILEDDRVAAVNLHFEGVRNVEALSRSAAKALRRGVPIVAIKAGRSQSGQRAAQSHTASLAGDDVVTSALFRRLGFIQVETATEALETLKMLTIAGAPAGRRMGFTTSSGTYAVMGADAAERAGMKLPEPSAEERERMRPLMETFLTPDNPLDVATGQFWTDKEQRHLFNAFLSGAYDVAVQSMSFPAEDTWEDESWYRSSTVFGQAAKAAGLPAAFVSPTQEGLPRRAREMLIGLGVAPLQGFHDGMRAIGNAVSWGEARARLIPDEVRIPEPNELGAGILLDEAAAKALLSDAGVAVPRAAKWQGEEALPDSLSYPVGLKVLDATVLHKSDIGGVALNLRGPDDLAVARDAMRQSIRAHGHSGDTFLVEEMIAGGVAELLVGVRAIPDIGQCLTLAVGGVATELLEDAATLLLPTRRDAVAEAMRGLKMYPLLTGWRGAPAADLDAALDTIDRICDLAATHRDRLIELEINPLIIRGRGGGAIAADAVLRLRSDHEDAQ